jgi:sugar phosphate isomerase/epimerase
MLSRRGVLSGLGTSLAMPAGADPLGLPIGIQLYTVAGPLKADPAGTLKRLRAIGYREVEASGFAGLPAAGFRKLLDDAGLHCASCHLPLADGDWQRQFEDAIALGAHYAVASTMTSRKSGNPADIADPADKSAFDRMTAEMNRIGAAAAKAGLQFGYHNHDFEFKRFADGQLAFDRLLQRTDEKLVVFEVDCGWMAVGGHDPAAYLRRFPRRIRLLHIKDFPAATLRPSTTTKGHPGTELGRGFIDYRSIFAAAKAARIAHYFVEQEPPFTRMPALAAAKVDYDYLHALP